ncbi:hypothetical protein PQX77_020180 [Marasmius sp. AFHP31]|nr:hypothetical protein PQX77_020180 [Marasmius sp. AFHP31]
MSSDSNPSLFKAGLQIDPAKVFYAVCLVFVVDRVLAFQRKRKAMNYLSGIRSAFPPLSPAGVLFSTKWWQAAVDVIWIRRHELWRNQETISVVPWFLGSEYIYTANLDVMKQIISTGQTRSTFVKSPETVTGVSLFGDNVFTTEGDEWRKHRRIMSPAFGNSLYQLVWDQSVKTYRDMIAGEGWENKKSFDVPAIQKATFKFALIVLGVCSFGFDFDWTAPATVSDGEMSAQEAMRIVIDNYIFLTFAPGWVKRLPFKSFKQSLRAYNLLDKFMQDQVNIRREEIRGHASGEYKRKDAFSMLVQANESDENAKNKLSDRDLIGNVFVMLIAGHETTASTFAATLGYLAINPQAQDEAVKQIVDVVGWDRDPEFSDYNNLNKVLATFFEALRLFPAAYIMIRRPKEDFVLDIPNPRDQEGTQPFPIPKGTWAVIDMVGIHRNPRYYEDPEEYKPSRWHAVPNDSEQFTAFSFGPRTCIGRKFATTEAVAFLTVLLRDWKVEPLLQSGETPEGWKKRVMDAKLGFTMVVHTDVPLKFTRRERF